MFLLSVKGGWDPNCHVKWLYKQSELDHLSETLRNKSEGKIETQYSFNKEFCCFTISIVCPTLLSSIACLSRVGLDCKKENIRLQSSFIRVHFCTTNRKSGALLVILMSKFVKVAEWDLAGPFLRMNHNPRQNAKL